MAANVVTCFNKKSVTSTKSGEAKQYYFIALRDLQGYAADQIVSKNLYDSITEVPCQVEFTIDCSSGKVRNVYRVVK